MMKTKSDSAMALLRDIAKAPCTYDMPRDLGEPEPVIDHVEAPRVIRIHVQQPPQQLSGISALVCGALISFSVASLLLSVVL